MSSDSLNNLNSPLASGVSVVIVPAASRARALRWWAVTEGARPGLVRETGTRGQTRTLLVGRYRRRQTRTLLVGRY